MMALRKEQLSPVRLNNKGALLLHKGRYQDAARCFARASKITISAISIEEPARTKNNETLCLEAGNTNNASTQTSNTVSPPSWSSCREPSCAEPPRKRTKRNFEVTSATTVCVPPPVQHTLGRPLWIQPRRKVPLDPHSFSATLTYNLALSFHLMAIRKEQQNQEQEEASRPMYKKALELYVLSSRSMTRAPLSTTVQSPIFVVVLHNISLVCLAIQGENAVVRYQSQLAHLLRLMCVLDSANGKRQYEAFYIRMMCFQSKSDTTAAAA